MRSPRKGCKVKRWTEMKLWWTLINQIEGSCPQKDLRRRVDLEMLDENKR